MLKKISVIIGAGPKSVVELLILRYHKEVKANKESVVRADDYPHLKVSNIVNVRLRKQLETRGSNVKLLVQLQSEEYLKNNFDLHYPLLVNRGPVFESLDIIKM
ncbi:MAG: hypothetical protein ACPKOI_04625 [Pleomorphochaeta sp.]